MPPPWLELVERPQPVGWALRLHPKSPAAVPASELGDGGGGGGGAAGTSAPDMVVEVLATRPGVAVLLKPAGVSTEALMHAAARSPSVPHTFAPAALVQGLPSVSRLDKPTSGAIAVPLCAAGERHLTEQFASRRVHKTYLCLVKGVIAPSGEVDAKLHAPAGWVANEHFRVYVSPKGKEAVTRFRRVQLLQRAPRHEGGEGEGQQQGGGGGGGADGGAACACGHDGEVYSLVEAEPLTGRTHQIRAHMASIGHPLVSDTKYKTKLGKRQLKWCARLFLHAARLELLDLEGAVLQVVAPLAPDLAACLATMRDYRVSDSDGDAAGSGDEAKHSTS